MQDSRSRLQAAAVATVILALQPLAPACAYTETVLHNFSHGDGYYAQGNLIMDQNGNLFGTTVYGDLACGKNSGCGTVFRLAPDGTYTVLHAFSKPDGIFPYGGLVEDQSGNLYGTTSLYGKLGRRCCGTIFEVTQQGVYTVLHRFAGGVDGEYPYAGLIADQQGNLYGTTTLGGPSGYGTVFELSQGGVYSVLLSFSGGAKGSNVFAPLVEDPAGNLYGTTEQGGKTRCFHDGGGIVFKLAPDGTETVLYAFRGGNDGCGPGGGLTLDASGNLYGTTVGGGGSGCNGYGCGTVFEVAADGTETVLSRFTRTGTSAPNGGVILDPAGNLFGTTTGGNSGGCGTVFEIVPRHSAKTLYSFTCGDDGGDPDAGLLMDQSGNLYGTTLRGGKAALRGSGVVFELKK